MSLYQKYRPKDFNEIKGNIDVVATLDKLLSGNDIPHSYLLYGQTGCGKTTIARIIAERLGCKGRDLSEIDSGQFRGIDTVRDIRSNSSYLPLEGKCRVWIIDECFPKGTKVLRCNNVEANIEDIKEGDIIQNLNNKDIVKSIFINKVLLNRVLKVRLSNGLSIFCTSDHQFLTNKGWVKAKNLKNLFVYYNIFSNFVLNNEQLNIDGHEKREKILCNMWQNTYHRSKNVLLKILSFSGTDKEKRKKKLSLLWKGDCILSGQKRNLQQEILQSKLCSETQNDPSGNTRNSFFRRIQTKIINWFAQVSYRNQKWSITKEKSFRKNEDKKSFIQSNEYSKGQGNKKNQWNTSYLERRKRWQRKINTTTNFIIKYFRMGNRSSNKDRSFTFRWFRFPFKLQGRYRQYFFKNRNRNRWEKSYCESLQIKGLEKDGIIKKIRVESITFYKQGSNDESFRGIIEDQERNQGFVNFYDLEIKNHHSYFANGILVHNCQKLTGDAQSGLLKILEDTPKHVYFILCTTDPQKLLAAIRGRCIQLQMNPLSDKQMYSLLYGIVKKENQNGLFLKTEIYEQIIQDSFGLPRNAINILEQVLAVPEERRLIVARQTAEKQSQTIELCRALIKGESWNKVRVILEGLKDQEPESIRRAILGYCQAILLKEENDVAGFIMECMIEPFYNTGFAGLLFACYKITNTN